MKYLLPFVTSIINPTYWFSNAKVNYEYDKKLRKALENPVFTDIGPYTCKINGKTIWISNYPYAYGSPWNGFKGVDLLPRRCTRIVLRSELNKHLSNCAMREWE